MLRSSVRGCDVLIMGVSKPGEIHSPESELGCSQILKIFRSSGDLRME